MSTQQNITNPEFQSHRLNAEGIEKVEQVKGLFDNLLNALIEQHGPFDPATPRMTPQTARHLSIVKTKLEEACMFAVKAMSCDPANQLDLSGIDFAFSHVGRKESK